MKFFYVMILSIFLSANVMAEDSFSNNQDKQNCSQDKSFVENSSFFIPNSKYKVANLKCGLKPIRPVNCKGNAICACDANGNCAWVWNCW